MRWLNNLNDALQYIEANLDGEIDLNQAAKIAYCSVFHFQRIFPYLADIPLSEYIRRRRMTKAAFELQTSDIKVIDVALKYGYESPTAFNRAFQSIHGVAPSVAREQGIVLKAYPPISFKITIKGEAEMDYRIENKEAFKIVGVKEHYAMSVEECFNAVPMFWQKTIQSGAVPNILALNDIAPFGLLGVSTCMNGEDLDYYIASATKKEAPKNMESYTVPAGTWAVFTSIGAMPYAIQNLQKRIINEWLPTSGYEYANAPDIEVYFDGDQQADDYRCEVWLPVVKRKDE